MDNTAKACVLVLVVVMAGGLCSAVDLQDALKMAQCRAHCLDKVRRENKKKCES